MRARDIDQTFGMGGRCGGTPPHHFKCCEMVMAVRDGACVPGLGRPGHHLFGDRSRPRGLAKRPQH